MDQSQIVQASFTNHSQNNYLLLFLSFLLVGCAKTSLMQQATIMGNVSEVRRYLDTGTPINEIGTFKDPVGGRKGQSIHAAASSTQITTTLQDKGHGIFTYYFLKGLDGSGTTAKKLYEYLKPMVQDEAHRQNREQTPTLYTPNNSDPILR